MGPTSLRVMALGMAFLCPGLPAESQPKSGVPANGVFVGRSGKPMARMRLILADVTGDHELSYAKIKLAESPPMAVTDDKGQFQFGSVAPGMYAVLFMPVSGSKALPAEIGIKAFAAVTQSPTPLLRDVEIGATGPPNADRSWGRTFTLLKGHTFYAQGANMKIWNATARYGPQGPYMEIRKGVIFQQQFPSQGPIKLVAWSY